MYSDKAIKRNQEASGTEGCGKKNSIFRKRIEQCEERGDRKYSLKEQRKLHKSIQG